MPKDDAYAAPTAESSCTKDGVVAEIPRRAAAVGLRDLETEQTLPPGREPHFTVDAAGVDELLRARCDLTFDELTHRVAEEFVVGVKDRAEGHDIAWV